MDKVVRFEDRKLVHNYLTGDREAGRVLYENTYMPLLCFIRKQGKNTFSAADCEEIVSETMVRSVELLDRFTGESTFYTFLCGIAKNVIREHLKKSGREIPTDFCLFPEEESQNNLKLYLSEYGILPEEYVIRKEDIERVFRAFEQLRCEHQEYYEIIQLRLVNKVPYATISQLSGESVDALESRYRRALSALKKILKSKKM